MKLSIAILLFLSFIVIECVTADGETGGPCPRSNYNTHGEVANCWMRFLIDFARTTRLARNQIPFSGFILNNATNEIACWGGLSTGANSDIYSLTKLGWGLHLEESAYLNCTKLFPSPTGNERANPGWKTREHIQFSTAVPCSMGCANAHWARLGGIYYATDEFHLRHLGLAQFTTTCEQLLNGFRNRGGQPVDPIPPFVIQIEEESGNAIFDEWRNNNPLPPNN